MPIFGTYINLDDPSAGLVVTRSKIMDLRHGDALFINDLLRVTLVGLHETVLIEVMDDSRPQDLQHSFRQARPIQTVDYNSIMCFIRAALTAADAIQNRELV